LKWFSQRIFLERNKTIYVGEKVEGSTNNDNERGMWGEQSMERGRGHVYVCMGWLFILLDLLAPSLHGSILVLVRARGGRSED
jgi:hypothetical protein